MIKVAKVDEYDILRLTEEEHVKMFGEESTFDDGKLAFLYVSTNEECPYIGVEKTNGALWVYGARVDMQVDTLEEVIGFLKMS